MSPAEPVVIRIAGTPAQAKVFAAMLQAEGIPAHIDGDSLADEVAASRRMMNLLGVRVLVPACDKARAEDILANASIDEQELEAQAMAAEGPETAPATVSSAPPNTSRILGWWAILASVAALLFFSLWMAEREPLNRMTAWMARERELANDTPAVDANKLKVVRTLDGVQWRRISDNGLDGEGFDRDHDGKYEELRYYHADGSPKMVMQYDAAGRELSCDRFRDGMRMSVVSNGAGDADEFTLFSADGKELKRQHWDGAKGYVDGPRPK